MDIFVVIIAVTAHLHTVLASLPELWPETRIHAHNISPEIHSLNRFTLID
jgi:hypothetical protein